MRNLKFTKGEYYHIYNRGVDHRNIVLDQADSDRFVLGLELFNSVEQIGSIKDFQQLPEVIKSKPRKRLVDIICYCLNPNHFHLILREIREGGISQFMKRIGGHSHYFNLRHKRTGTLFEGKFKAKHITSNDYLLHLSSYVNVNDQLHKIGYPVTDLVRSSWEEYKTGEKGLCQKAIILEQFENYEHYKKFVLDNIPAMLEKRGDYEDLKKFYFD